MLVGLLALSGCAAGNSSTARPAGTAATVSPTLSAGSCGDAYLCNPWGYNFNCCHNVLLGAVGSPSVDQFCAFFKCSPTIYQNNGVVAMCEDGTFTRSAGPSSDKVSCGGRGKRGARGLLSRK